MGGRQCPPRISHALPARPFGVLLGKRRHRDHLAMSALAAQPAEKAALQKLRALLERHGLTEWAKAYHAFAGQMTHYRWLLDRLDAIMGSLRGLRPGGRRPNDLLADFEGCTIAHPRRASRRCVTRSQKHAQGKIMRGPAIPAGRLRGVEIAGTRKAVTAVASSSACGVAAIHSECVTDHEACGRATKPKNGGGDLLRPTKSPNRLVFHQFFHGFLVTGHHARNHRRIDDTRAHSIDANAPGRVIVGLPVQRAAPSGRQGSSGLA
jgi:hypothetical protein